MYTVKLTYFKPSGKLYSGGEYRSYHEELSDIWDETKQKIESRCLPGLVAGHSHFVVSIDVPDHPNNHPHLFT